MNLIKIMAKKVSSAMYAKLVIEHLDRGAVNHDLEEICREIGEIQLLKKATGANTGGKSNNQEKEVHFANTDGDKFQGVCCFCNKRAGHKRADCTVR